MEIGTTSLQKNVSIQTELEDIHHIKACVLETLIPKY